VAALFPSSSSTGIYAINGTSFYRYYNTLAANLFPLSGVYGVYSLSQAQLNRLAQRLTGQTSTGSNGTANTVFPSFGGSGFFSLSAPTYTRVAEPLFPPTGNSGYFNLASTAYNRVAQTLFPATGTTGFFSLGKIIYDRVSQVLYGCNSGIESLSQALFTATPSATGLANVLWPAGSALTGFYGLSSSAQYSRFYDSIVAALLPEGSAATGIYGASGAALTRFYNFLAQGMYGAQAGITSLVSKLYAEAPVPVVASQAAAGEGQPGFQEKAIVNGQSVWKLTAGCANGAYMTGGTYEVVCTSSTPPAPGEVPPTSEQLQDLSGSLVSIRSATIITGKTIISGGTYTAASARISVTAVGTSVPGIDYYSGIMAYMCQKNSGSCTADPLNPSRGCCTAAVDGTASCDCSGCDGSGAVTASCAAGCRCYTSADGSYTDTDCGRVMIGSNYWGCSCKVQAIPVCVS
jgi:hypothetical protein